MKIRALYLTPLLSLGLSACQIAVNIEVSGPASAPIFDIQEEGIFWAGPSRFGELAIASTTNGWSTLWSMAARSGCDTNARRVTYGQIPAGFTADRPAPVLQEGHSYSVFVSGCGRTGLASFRIVGGRVVPI